MAETNNGNLSQYDVHGFPYEKVIIQSWSELKQYFNNHLISENWIFRGIDSAEYKLEPKIERNVERESGGHKRNYLEFIMVNNFQRKSKLYLKSKFIPKKKDYLGWLSLMQHYGASTRLLDFSKSFYIACYFAFENKFNHDDNGHVAIWAINYIDLVKAYKNPIHKQIKEYNENIFKKNKDFIEEKIERNILYYEPFYLESRIANQRGAFLCSTTIYEINSFEINLKEAIGSKNPNNIVKKIIIPKSIRNEVIKELKLMTIDTEFIYPGLEGFARSLNFYTSF